MIGISSSVHGRSPDARAHERRLPQPRHEIARRVEQVADAGHGRPLVESGVFDRRADQNRLLGLREPDNIAIPTRFASRRRPSDASCSSCPRTGLTGSGGTPSMRNLAGPAAGCQDHVTSRHAVVDRAESRSHPSRSPMPGHSCRNADAGSVLDCRGRQRSRKIGGDDEPMRRHEQGARQLPV